MITRIIVDSYRYPQHVDDHPRYQVSSYKEFCEITQWMLENQVDYSMCSPLPGYAVEVYVFQIRSNHHWFALRWLRDT